MAPVIPYTRQTWTDGSGGGTPVSAARLAVIEEGIVDVSQAPTVQVTHNTTNSVLNSTLTALACNTDNIDQAAGVTVNQHDTVTNNSRLTALYAGIYLVTASDVTWSANPTNARIQFRKTGVTPFGTQQILGDWRTMGTTGFVALAVSDYVECMVLQVSGGTLTVAASFLFNMTRVA